MNQATHSFHAARARGFSVIELMVSVAIGMLAIMFATRMITGGQQNRQNAMGGSDAMQNGMQAMFSISSDATQAGFGLNDPILVGCETQFTDAKGYTMATMKVPGSAATRHPLAAVIIENNGTKSDKISLYSAASTTGTGSARMLDNYTGEAFFTIDREPYAYLANDAIVVANESGIGTCALAQVSVKPVAGADKPVLRIDSGADARLNTGALGVNYTGGLARVFNLGQGDKLSFHTWSVKDGFLQLSAMDMAKSGTTPATIADNIVAIKAQYGFDTRAGAAFTPEFSTKIARWSADMIDAEGHGSGVAVGTSGDIQRVVAVRLAVVARSKTPERPAADGTCAATTAAPRVFAAAEPDGVTAVPIDVDVAVDGDTVSWKCYRYRVFETIVPIRNAAWRPSAW